VSAAAGIAWLTLGAESIARPGVEGYRDSFMLIPWLLSMVSLAIFRSALGPSAGKLARHGLSVAIAAMVVAVVGQFGFVVDSLFLKVFAGMAMVGWIGGMGTTGFGLWRTGAVPRWLAAALGLTQPLTMAAGVALSPWVPLENNGSYSGAVVHGLTWLALTAYFASAERFRPASPR